MRRKNIAVTQNWLLGLFQRQRRKYRLDYEARREGNEKKGTGRRNYEKYRQRELTGGRFRAEAHVTPRRCLREGIFSFVCPGRN